MRSQVSSELTKAGDDAIFDLLLPSPNNHLPPTSGVPTVMFCSEYVGYQLSVFWFPRLPYEKRGLNVFTYCSSGCQKLSRAIFHPKEKDGNKPQRFSPRKRDVPSRRKLNSTRYLPS